MYILIIFFCPQVTRTGSECLWKVSLPGYRFSCVGLWVLNITWWQTIYMSALRFSSPFESNSPLLSVGFLLSLNYSGIYAPHIFPLWRAGLSCCLSAVLMIFLARLLCMSLLWWDKIYFTWFHMYVYLKNRMYPISSDANFIHVYTIVWGSTLCVTGSSCCSHRLTQNPCHSLLIVILLLLRICHE